MRIEDLLEFEGLTADHVRAWLRANGWERAPEEDIRRQECWRLDGGAKGSLWMMERFLDSALDQISRWSGLPVQSLLTKINPRMRPGWPTEEEIEAHSNNGGKWLCMDADTEAIVIGRFVHPTRFRHTEWLADGSMVGYGCHKEDGERLAFWPCDAHGNKVSRVPR